MGFLKRVQTFLHRPTEPPLYYGEEYLEIADSYFRQQGCRPPAIPSGELQSRRTTTANQGTESSTHAAGKFHVEQDPHGVRERRARQLTPAKRLRPAVCTMDSRNKKLPTLPSDDPHPPPPPASEPDHHSGAAMLEDVVVHREGLFSLVSYGDPPVFALELYFSGDSRPHTPTIRLVPPPGLDAMLEEAMEANDVLRMTVTDVARMYRNLKGGEAPYKWNQDQDTDADNISVETEESDPPNGCDELYAPVRQPTDSISSLAHRYDASRIFEWQPTSRSRWSSPIEGSATLARSHPPPQTTSLPLSKGCLQPGKVPNAVSPLPPIPRRFIKSHLSALRAEQPDLLPPRNSPPAESCLGPSDNSNFCAGTPPSNTSAAEEDHAHVYLSEVASEVDPYHPSSFSPVHKLSVDRSAHTRDKNPPVFTEDWANVAHRRCMGGASTRHRGSQSNPSDEIDKMINEALKAQMRIEGGGSGSSSAGSTNMEGRDTNASTPRPSESILWDPEMGLNVMSNEGLFEELENVQAQFSTIVDTLRMRLGTPQSSLIDISIEKGAIFDSLKRED